MPNCSGCGFIGGSFASWDDGPLLRGEAVDFALNGILGMPVTRGPGDRFWETRWLAPLMGSRRPWCWSVTWILHELGAPQMQGTMARDGYLERATVHARSRRSWIPAVRRFIPNRSSTCR